MDLNRLENIEQLDQLVELSKQRDKGIAIFKHSTRCSISSMAMSRLQRLEDNGENPEIYLLDLIANRALSNRVAEQFELEHESPQLLWIVGGKLVKHASHFGIDAGFFKDGVYA